MVYVSIHHSNLNETIQQTTSGKKPQIKPDNQRGICFGSKRPKQSPGCHQDISALARRIKTYLQNLGMNQKGAGSRKRYAGSQSEPNFARWTSTADRTGH